MIVYEATKSEFLTDVFMDKLVNNIRTNFADKIGKVNEREVRSWDNSMQYMYRILADPDIPPNAGVAIEFRVPYTSKRIDFLISGRGESKNSVVIVELKQWESVAYLKERLERVTHSFEENEFFSTPSKNNEV